MCKKKICLLGIDIGGTFTKILVIDKEGKQLSLAKQTTDKAYLVHYDSPQRILECEVLWLLIKETIAEAINMLSSEYSIQAIGVSAFGCTQVFLDKEDKPIQYSLSENQINQEFRKYENIFTKETYFQLTGYPFECHNSGIYLSCACNHSYISKPQTVLSIDDYINYRLTGNKVRNYSTAVSSGLWDRKEEKWLSSFCDISGLDATSMGQPVNSATCVGRILTDVALELNIPSTCNIYTAGHDYECAAFACSPWLDENLFNITGTIDIFADFNHKNFKEHSKEHSKAWRVISDYHVIPDYRSYMLETFGATHLKWVKNFLISDHRWDKVSEWDCCFQELEKKYQSIAKASEFYIPHTFGQLIPNRCNDVYGILGGLKQESNSISVFKAIIEGISFQSKQILEHFQLMRGEKKAILMVGGGSQSLIWTQIKSNILNKTIIVPDIQETSALGAAFLAGIGEDIYQDFKEIKNVMQSISTREFHPDKKLAEYYNSVFKTVYLPMCTMNQKMAENRIANSKKTYKGFS